MNQILHIFGLCADTHSHFDLLDLVVAGGATTTLIYLKLHIKVYLLLIKDFFKNK